jgi:hypothetical protein
MSIAPSRITVPRALVILCLGVNDSGQAGDNSRLPDWIEKIDDGITYIRHELPSLRTSLVRRPAILAEPFSFRF